MKSPETRNRERLLVIGAVDRYIQKLAYSTICHHLAMDHEDLVSEARLKVITIVDHYRDRGFREMVQLSITAVRNLFVSIVRKRYTERRAGVLIDLDEFAESIYDENEVSELFLDSAITHLYGMLNSEERKVLTCLITPPKKLVKKVEERGGKEVTITVGDVANHLGIGRCKVHRITDKIKSLIPEVANAYSY